MIAVDLTKNVPPQVGKLSIYVYDWDWSDVNDYKETFEPLQTHNCTKEELGLTTGEYSKPHLFPSAKGSEEL